MVLAAPATAEALIWPPVSNGRPPRRTVSSTIAAPSCCSACQPAQRAHTPAQPPATRTAKLGRQDLPAHRGMDAML